MDKNPKPAVDIETNSRQVSFQQPVVSESPETSKQQTSQEASSPSTRISPVDEDERFFLQLYPNTSRDSWLMMFSRRSNSSNGYRGSRHSYEEIYLQREMGLFSSLNFLIIVTIGSGIFIYPPVILQRAGSVTEALLVWLFCGIFTLLIAITYGELIFLVSQSGEKFSYLLTAFSPLHKFFGPIPAFLEIWIECLFLRPAEASLLALFSAEHLYAPLASSLEVYANFTLTEPVVVKQIIGMLGIGFVTCVNFKSFKTSVRIQNVFAVLTLSLCFVIIGCGSHNLSLGQTDSFNSLFRDMKGDTTGLLKAVYLGMWAYEGWINVVSVSEEIKNPLKILPRAILVGVPFVTVLFVAMNVAYLCVLTPDELMSSTSGFALDSKFHQKLFEPLSTMMPAFFALSSFSTSMCLQLGTSRTLFAAGREGHMLEVLSYLNVKTRVPTPAILTQAMLSLIYIACIPIIDLVEYANFVIWLFYAFSFVALIILRVQMPDTYRLYKTPLCLPIILTVLAILVCVEPLLRAPTTEFFIGVAIVFLGIFVYSQTVYKQKTIPGLRCFQTMICYLLDVAPPTALPENYRTFSTIPTNTVASRLVRRQSYYRTTMD